MNKQELIDYCKTLKEDKNRFINCIDVDRIIKKIEQLDESQKVKIPQFVADWIEVAKPTYSLYGAMVYGSPGGNKWLENWNNQETFALAWIFGYEVEKEKRYLVKVKGVYLNSCLVFDKGNKNGFFLQSMR